IFSRPANSSSFNVNGNIERKSRTAGLSWSIVTSTELDPSLNRRLVPMTCCDPFASFSCDEDPNIDAATGALADAELAAPGTGLAEGAGSHAVVRMDVRTNPIARLRDVGMIVLRRMVPLIDK